MNTMDSFAFTAANLAALAAGLPTTGVTTLTHITALAPLPGLPTPRSTTGPTIPASTAGIDADTLMGLVGPAEPGTTRSFHDCSITVGDYRTTEGELYGRTLYVHFPNGTTITFALPTNP